MAIPGQTELGAQWHGHTDRRMGRRKLITMIGGLTIAWPLACSAQQPQSTPLKRVGFLTSWRCPIEPDSPTRRRLAELGWVEGRNFVFDCVLPDRLDEIPALARELVTRRPDVLIAGPWKYVTALKRETTTIPIVMQGTWEPVRWNLTTNFAQREGNVTGVAWFGLFSKQ